MKSYLLFQQTLRNCLIIFFSLILVPGVSLAAKPGGGGGGGGPTEITALPFTIDASGAYFLNGNLTSTGDGVIVTVDDVTIDLKGFSLVGPGKTSGNNNGISIQSHNVEVSNGTVRDFGGDGIRSSVGNKHRAIAIRAIGNGDDGISLHSGGGSQIKDCVLAENGNGAHSGHGAVVTGNTIFKNDFRGMNSGWGSTVSNNTVYLNGGTGMIMGPSSTIIDNTVFDNAGVGIDANSGSMVSRNSVYENDLTGISCVHSSAITVSNNTVVENNRSNSTSDAGILAGEDCLVKNNNLESNNQYNIHVTGSGNVIEENKVSNSTVGIQFSGTGNFYANNRASGNTTAYGGNVPTGGADGGGNASF
jgi:parallel beta-helix repeat protein